MDVLVLIDKLDDLVHTAKAVPLTDQVRIDREEIYDILDQMRATIPEEIKQARWIVKERPEMLAEAKREVDRIIGEAREQAVRAGSQTELVKGAANPTARENLLGASTRWGPFGPSAIAGYASETSLSQGDTLHLHVSASPGADYRVELYRLGWYSGTGGRLMGCLPTCIGFRPA